MLNLPTAVHAVAEVHDTPLSIRLLWGLRTAGSGTLSVAHVEPSHVSANGRIPEVLLVESFPTAVQAVAEVHDTSLSPAETAPDGAGGFWIVQVEPSQASASGPVSL